MATDWIKFKVVDLKAELKRRGLSYNGLKGELVARLEAADNENSESELEDEQPEGEDEQEDDTAQPEEPEEPEADATEDAPEPAEGDAESTVVPDDAPGEQPDAVQEDEPANTTEDRIATPEVAETVDKEQVDNTNSDNEVGLNGDEQSAAGDFSKHDSSPMADKQIKETTPNEAPSESVPISQKRKRRSVSPTPIEEDVARKRVRAEDTTNGDAVHVDPKVDEADAVAISNEMDVDKEPISGQEPETTDLQDVDYDRDVSPATHAATPALYISNLMRPLRTDDIRAHLASLASSNLSESTNDIIIKFYLDQIRTHAFAVFCTTAAASRVRAALHDRVWPNESNRKALVVDFVPPEKVDGWIDMEESSGSGRSGTRWEVVYRHLPDGTVQAQLESGSAPASKPAPTITKQPLKSGIDMPSAIPIGPRGHREIIAPTGPRAVRPGTGPGPRPPPSTLDTVVERTRARPAVSFQLVSEDLAQRRITNMRRFHTHDKNRDYGREINRYSFEDGDSFVDRGKEVFEGIRPPHRERAIERERRGGGRGASGGSGGGSGGGGYGGRPPRRGPPPFRPRSDRYLPGRGGSDGRDDRRSRYDDERSSRHGSDRDKDYRSNRR